jgi:hypothetical protein
VRDRFIEGQSSELAKFCENRVRESLGPLWEALPEGALMHDQNAYLKSKVRCRPSRALSSGSHRRRSREQNSSDYCQLKAGMSDRSELTSEWLFQTNRF